LLTFHSEDEDDDEDELLPGKAYSLRALAFYI